MRNPLVADWVGLAAYDAYVGKIRIERNVFDCRASGGNCLNVAGADTIVRDNTFTVTGNVGEAILVEGPLPQPVRIEGNTLWVENGMGIVLNSPGADQCVVSHNTTCGSGPAGIYVASPARPNPGSHVITGNPVSGFRSQISIDMSKHTGTVVH